MDMSLEKIEITNRVYGKMEQGKIQFYLDKEKIGYLSGEEVILNKGYEYQNDCFYEYEEGTVAPNERYVDNCDQGWC